MLTHPTRCLLFSFIACVGTVSFITPARAQQNLPDLRLTLDVRDVPLSEFLEDISAKTHIPFSYNPKKIQATQRLSYHAVDQPLREMLDEIARRFGLIYEHVENQIILQPAPKNSASKPSTLSGYIRDGKTGEALIGATVSLPDLHTGVASNGFGFFSLTVPKGNYQLAFSFVGYRPVSMTLDLSSGLHQDIAMTPDPPVLAEVMVNPNAVTDAVQEIQASKVRLRPKTVEERPALFGETDVIKSLESVPGIKLHSDGSTFYYVRGGNRDQNLVLLDDAPIYNPSHMLGFFSTIIPDAINDIVLYKGNMPAGLGGRLSSVLDVRTKKGNDQHLESWGDVGLISTKLGLEGPFKKNKSSFLVSARVSRLKWFFHLLDKDITKFNFYDITAKTNFGLNEHNRIFFSFYTGGDNYFAANSGISWINTAGTFRWNHTFTDRLFMNTTLAASSYDYFLYADVANNTKWSSHISNLNLKSDFSYFIKPENELAFGWSINGYNFNPGNLTTNLPTSSIPGVSARNSVEFVAYGNHEVKLNRWGLNYGVRLSSWVDTGPAFEFVYDQQHHPVDTLTYTKGQSYKKFGNAEPRLTVSYEVNEKSSFKASYSHNVQNIHLITNSTSPFTSMEVWLPSSINIRPQTSDQGTFGYYRALPRTTTLLSAEVFYKKMHHQIDYTPQAETLLNPLLESQLRFGNAVAYGIELMAKKDEGRWRGLVGYSYARAIRKFADINDGKPFNAFYDRPNQINAMLTYDLQLRWTLGMNWTYSTGAPYSSPVSFYNYNGTEVPIYGQKNNDRLPDYHRLDVSATVKLNKNTENRFRHSLTLSIFNVYGRKNVLFIDYNKTETSDGTFKIPNNLLDTSRATSQFYLFRFTPAISYNFKWL
jgi:hypothetical protein